MKPNPVSPSSLNAELINLPAFSGRKWWVKFDEPEFSCEAGLTAIAASKIGDQLLRFLASAIDDSRCAADHKIEELDSQRGFLILGGNCDVTDCDHLSKDIVLRSARRTPPDLEAHARQTRFVVRQSSSMAPSTEVATPCGAGNVIEREWIVGRIEPRDETKKKELHARIQSPARP